MASELLENLEEMFLLYCVAMSSAVLTTQCCVTVHKIEIVKLDRKWIF